MDIDIRNANEPWRVRITTLTTHDATRAFVQLKLTTRSITSMLIRDLNKEAALVDIMYLFCRRYL